jgi:hypothetical protein
METIHAFTSITANYIPKARVLAASFKKFQPSYQFHLVLCDPIPENFNLDQEPFDSVITIADLPIENPKSWIFKHTVVELCTAVKGATFKKILADFNPAAVLYLDPDIVIFSELDSLIQHFNEASILLTPHLTAPEVELGGIVDNEICSLRHGIYNLGFLGVKNSPQGNTFVNWWCDRLLQFCYNDIPQGLFTDQRWIDFVPAFFEEHAILRDPIYNVATWNLTHRHVSGSLRDGIKVNGEPLCFYHFSGFDSGAQEAMLKRYAADNPVLFEMRKWYIDECELKGQGTLGNAEFGYSRYDNGEKITNHQRLVYRTRQDLQKAFPDPFLVVNSDKSYLSWYRNQLKYESDMLKESFWLRLKRKVRSKMAQYKFLKV